MFACERTARADGGRVSGRASSEQSVGGEPLWHGHGTVRQAARGHGPGMGGCPGRGHTGMEKVQRAERSRGVGGGVRDRGQA